MGSVRFRPGCANFLSLLALTSNASGTVTCSQVRTSYIDADCCGNADNLVPNLDLIVPCHNTLVLKNIDFECGHAFNSDRLWSLTGDATLSDAATESLSGSRGAKIQVSSANNLNDVILSNVEVENNGSLDNRQFKFGVKGKSGDGQYLKFKLRVKYKLGETTRFSASSVFTLEPDYSESPYVFAFDVPHGMTQLQFQLICGAIQGTYYFDDFTVTTNTLTCAGSAYASC